MDENDEDDLMNILDKSSPSNRPWLWILRGSPGVGKSAVGRRLKGMIPGIAVIEVDVLRSMQSDVDWKNKESHHLGLDAAAVVAQVFHDNGIELIIVIDTFLGERLDYFISQIDTRPEIITLVAEDDVLVKRALGREIGFKDQDTTIEMNSCFMNNQSTNELLIDTTKISADEVALRIMNKIMSQGSSLQSCISIEKAKEKTIFKIPPTSNGRLVLVRHASPEHKYHGPYNLVPGPGLSDKGIKQAKALEMFFSEWTIDRWVTSPFERARQTAIQISSGIISLEESENWGEVGPSEPFSEVKKRVAKWLENNFPSGGQTIMVIAHGASINAAVDIFAPNTFQQAKKDKHNLIIGKGEAWIIEFEDGTIINCKLIFPNYID